MRRPIHAQLRDGTAALHRAVEHDLGFLLEPDLSLKRYSHLLSALHGFYAPLEMSLFRLDVLEPPLGVPLRRRARLLEADLRALGWSPAPRESSPPAAHLDELVSDAHLAGALYVIEGACLGGQVISRSVKQRLALRGDGGISFFVGDGRATGTRWARILSWLDESVQNGLCADETVDGARFTFGALARWLHASGVTH
jgi:heme oxygenase (biliverdin-IX-beta and delta-forming)